MEFAQILMATLLSIFFVSLLCYYYLIKNDVASSTINLPLNWPILGMIPGLVQNMHRGPDWATGILRQTRGNFRLKGPWFYRMEILYTADPSNVEYIQCKHHDDFHKGPKFNQIFDVLGDGIFNADTHKWKYQRKIALSALMSTRFRQLMSKSIKDKLERGLIPVLDHSYKQANVVDLQDIFQRLTSDFSFMVLLGNDPNELSLHPPGTHGQSFYQWIHKGEEVILRRHKLPAPLWKLERWLRVGKEGCLRDLIQSLDAFFYESIGRKREQLLLGKSDDLISLYIEENYASREGYNFKSPDIFLRDTLLTLLLAGQDTVSSTLTWFFWNISTHPSVESRLREELEKNNFGQGCDIAQLGNASKMVYLHAALCETLRLYPPVPFNHRASKKPETLPSGHHVKPWTMIFLSVYAMGRMKWVWGEDCDEFKPERWITEQGTIRHEPSYKFFAFNAGPRKCLGMDMTFVLIKATVCQVMRHNYQFKVVEGHRVEIAPSLVLWMKHGLKVHVVKK